MEIIEEHHSTDRLLRLIVTRYASGDVSIGFDGYGWHTHGDMLALIYNLPEEEAIRFYVDEIIGDETIIVIARDEGKIRDIWPTDDPSEELKNNPAEESLESRQCPLAAFLSY